MAYEAYGISENVFKKICDHNADIAYKICLKWDFSFCAIQMATISCQRIYYYRLFADPVIDWNLVYLVCFWLATKFIEESTITSHCIKEGIKGPYSRWALLRAELLILNVLNDDLGFNYLWPNGIPRSEWDKYLPQYRRRRSKSYS